ncbi:MAG: acyltransferase family protein [Ilumatobacteraceae bacterium]
MRDKPRRLDLLALVGLAGLGLLTWRLYLSEDGTDLGLQYDPHLFRGGFFLTGLATVFVIAAVTHRRSWTGKVLGNPVLRWIGVRSYGLYLFHWLVFQVVRKEAGIDLTWPQFAVGVAITFVIADLSYRLVETPVRTGRFGEWLRGQRVARTRRMYNRRRWTVAFAALVAGFAGFAGVSIATADNVCVGALECSLRTAGGTEPPPASIPPAPTTTSTAPSTTLAPSTTVASTTTVSVPVELVRAAPPPELDPMRTAPSTTAAGPVDTATDTTPPPTTLSPTTVPETSAAPPPPAEVTGTSVATQQFGPAPMAIGESVMQGATNQLAAGGFNVDAQQSRQGLDIAAIVEAHRAAGDIGSIVVIQAGTNGSVSDATYDRIMASLPADQTPYVFFLTVRAPKGWIDGNNERIDALPERYPNVHVIDWYDLSAANGVKFCADGFHIACGNGAAQTYANLIFEAIGRPDLKT